MRLLLAATFCAAVLLGIPDRGPAIAHEGHDHGQPPLSPANVLPRAESSSDSFELVAVAAPGELLIWLDRFGSNQPVEGAAIEVETPSGPARATVRRGAAYRLDAPWLASAGRFDLIFTVAVDGETDILPLTLDTRQRDNATGLAAHVPESSGLRPWTQPAVLIAAGSGFVIGLITLALLRRRRTAAVLILFALFTSVIQRTHAHEGDSQETAAPVGKVQGDERAQRLPDGTIFVPKSVQRIFGLRTILTQASTHRRAIELPGRIIPDPNASGFVQTSVGGRISPPPGGFLRLGTLVKEGDILAYVTPPIQAIDVSTMRQQQGELDQQISIVERRLARYESLAPSGAVARSQLEDTRLELQGLKERRASLDKVRLEPEALIAPVSGVIADGMPVAGQMAQPGAVVFHIIDPKRLWIEALSFDAIAGSEGASAVTASGRKLALAYRGSGFADRSQSIPIHFAIEGDTRDLRTGQFVTVLVVAPDEKTAVAVPRSSVVRGPNGQDFVFEHTAAEAYVPRPVRVESLDGRQVLIAAGLQPGRRVVVQGAELLDHVR
jgi:cobalt-zinc-cadmium efflux system membrane fusion protein